jgi:hypothetical protein
MNREAVRIAVDEACQRAQIGLDSETRARFEELILLSLQAERLAEIQRISMEYKEREGLDLEP